MGTNQALTGDAAGVPYLAFSLAPQSQGAARIDAEISTWLRRHMAG